MVVNPLNMNSCGQNSNSFFPLRMQSRTYFRSLLDLVSLPWASLMTALTLELVWEQKTTGMPKTGGTEKTHRSNDNREVTTAPDDLQGGMRGFPP